MGGTIVFILGIVILLVALGIAVGAGRAGEIGAAVLAVFLGLLVGGGMIVGSMVGTVDTKKVGVVTSFKKPTGEIKESGAYMIAPWKSVTQMDTAWQTDVYNFNVQAVGSATIGLEIRPRWRMVDSAAPDLFQNFKDFDGVKRNLFENELRDATNKQFQGYNPLTNVDVKSGLPLRTKEQFAAELKTDLEKRLGGRIEIERVAMTTIAPDPTTQDKISQQVAEFAKGKVLDQQKINADKQKLITETNAKVDKVTRCLEIADKNGTDPGTCGLLAGGSAGTLLNIGGQKTK